MQISERELICHAPHFRFTAIIVVVVIIFNSCSFLVASLFKVLLCWALVGQKTVVALWLVSVRFQIDLTCRFPSPRSAQNDHFRRRLGYALVTNSNPIRSPTRPELNTETTTTFRTFHNAADFCSPNDLNHSNVDRNLFHILIISG
jgi:hypothetical protein